MSEAVVGSILSAVITGVFTLIGTRMEARHSTASGGTTNSAPRVGPMQPAMQPAAGTINYGRVLIDIGILQLIINVVGYVIGYSIGSAMAGTASLADMMAVVFTVILVVGTLLLSVGFFWRALLVDRSIRWRHFSFVAVGVALTTLVLNSIFLPGANLNALSLVFAFAQTFICMGIGVGLANRTGR